MVFRGHVRSGIVVLDGDILLPDGAVVEVHMVNTPAQADADESIYRIGERAESTGIPDLAKNIDHYLYGHPKVDDVEE